MEFFLLKPLTRQVKDQTLKRYFYIVFFTLTLFIFFQCAERDRNNPFDPQSNIDSLDLSLRAIRPIRLLLFAGRRRSMLNLTTIFSIKKTEEEDTFSYLASLPASQREYSDSVKLMYRKHIYKLYLEGNGAISPPAKVLQITPGPNTFFILDSWNLQLLRLTYDLQYTVFQRYTIWIPKRMGRSENRSLITFPLYHYFEIYDIESNRLTAANYEMAYPYGVIYNSSQGNFTIEHTCGGNMAHKV